LENTRAYYKKIKGTRKYIEQPPEVRQKLNIKKIKRDKRNLKRLRTPYIDMRRKEIRIMYTRLKDDWIILTNCKKSLALILKQKITSWQFKREPGNLKELDPIRIGRESDTNNKSVKRIQTPRIFRLIGNHKREEK
jgi:hypothetical protein